MHLGDFAPDFSAWTSASHEEPLHFHRWLEGHWCILFSHPADFTPVCTTELGTVARLVPEFERRHCKVLGLSTDTVPDHQRWIQDINTSQDVNLQFPIIADEDMAIAKLYGMLDSPLHDGSNMNKRSGMPLTVRTVFIIDPAKKVRLMLIYPATVGRNFGEILRALDALQAADARPVATPADWQPGQDVIVRADVDNEEAKQRFGQVRSVLPYLRYVKHQQS